MYIIIVIDAVACIIVYYNVFRYPLYTHTWQDCRSVGPRRFSGPGGSRGLGSPKMAGVETGAAIGRGMDDDFDTSDRCQAKTV